MNKQVAHSDFDGLTDEIVNNLHGAFATIRTLYPALKQHGNHLIIKISSVALHKGFGSSIAYCGAKVALDAITRSPGVALGPEIRVMSVLRGGGHQFCARTPATNSPKKPPPIRRYRKSPMAMMWHAR